MSALSKITIAFSLSFAFVAAACSADLADMSACHLVSRRACERLAQCTTAPAACAEDLKSRCHELPAGEPSRTAFDRCASALEHAQCGPTGVVIPRECTDEPQLRYLWAEPDDGGAPRDGGAPVEGGRPPDAAADGR
jgi:hypothetical protein